MSLRMQGVLGELRRGYQIAAWLGKWTMDETGRVEAEPAEVDSYWMEQPGPPFALWLRLGSRAWVWRTVELLDAGTPMVIRADGSPQVRDA